MMQETFELNRIFQMHEINAAHDYFLNERIDANASTHFSLSKLAYFNIIHISATINNTLHT